MSGLRQLIHSTYKTAAEKVLPTLSQSAFKEKGVLTPQEFVTAGDYLVHSCPTWSWEAGDARKARPFLPDDKQYLITRNVPCLRRAADVEEYGERDEFEVEESASGGDGWVTASSRPSAPLSSTNEEGFEEIPSISDPLKDLTLGDGAGASRAAARLEEEDDDAIPDLADLDDSEDVGTVEAGKGPAAAVQPGANEAGDGVRRTRTYDLVITYDKYYQVPRFWLIGYDERRQPLAPDQVLEDISAEHARKTVTVEPHPHGVAGVQAASIHPCRHANVMRKLAGVVTEGRAEFRVEHYLILFLKFIASVVPTIEYDYTMPAGGN
ncbi:ATG3 [Auxenochlorella protothecoides x Auxenochlorella symbiontica]